jgi:hypothetical protein
MSDAPKQIRMSPTLQGRVRKFCENFKKKHGVALDFSTAVRALLEQALTQTEKK